VNRHVALWRRPSPPASLTLPAKPGMPTTVTIGVAAPRECEVVDTWIYADGNAVGIAQMVVSLSTVTSTVPTAKARRRPREAVLTDIRRRP
jgi:hypothetical protein